MQICLSNIFMTKIVYTFLFIWLVFSSCSPSRKNQKAADIHQLKFLDQYVVPFNQQFENTTIGGLSGIDFNSKKEEYYLISDDRSQKNPVRFYTAKILISQEKIDSVLFLKTVFLKDKTGNLYPNSQQDPFHTPDPEALRYNPKTNQFIWSSEGERIINSQKNILENPTITEVNSSGNFIDTFQLPQQVQMSPKEFGPRQNGVFEGLTFSENNESLFVSVEEPLYQDGERAGTLDSAGLTRIIKFDIATKKPVAQYAYSIDPVAFPPIIPSSFKVNGISDILNVSENQFLIIERSFSTGRLGCTIKVFLADISSAENVNNMTSLKNKSIGIVSKKLLLNMDNLGIYIDNIEGVTFGPTLSNGKRSLIFVADNNFNPLERSQFLLFEIE
jgi:hypothetical protein